MRGRSAGASVHARDGRVAGNWTALAYAAHAGHAAVARRLCALGARADLRTNHACSLLHVAVAGRGDPDTLQVTATSARMRSGRGVEW